LLKLNGSATINSNTRLRLTDGGTNEASSVWTQNKVDITHFMTSFDFTPGGASTEGLMFVLQNNNPSAIGTAGTGLGYEGIKKSVGAKFDFSPNVSQSGGYIQGMHPGDGFGAVNLAPDGINFHSGHMFRVQIVYDAATGASVTTTDLSTHASST